MKKALFIFLEAIPVLIMIGLIPIVKNDYILALIYLFITVAWIFRAKVEDRSREVIVFFFGLIALTISESIFVSTGVEAFQRRTLFGIMPIWLPVLWGYGFVAIKRGLKILN